MTYLKKLAFLFSLGCFITCSSLAQQVLDESASSKAAKLSLKYYKKEDYGKALAIMYSQFEKINSKKLKPGLKKKYLDAKKRLKKYRKSHLPLINAIERTEKALKEKEYLTAIGLYYFKVDNENVFPSTKVHYEKLMPKVEAVYKAIEDTLIQPAILEYQEIYLQTALDNTDTYSGNIEQCEAGNVPIATKLKLMRRANYFRRLCGVPEINHLDTARSDRAQYSSLIMAANRKLSHGPDSSWSCFTKIGRGQAGSSSLSLTNNDFIITGLMFDHGGHNKRTGHRTNLLYPHGDRYSIGLVKYGYKSWALTFDVWYSDGFNFRNAPLKNKFITYAYPQKGVIPAPLLARRWSFTEMGLKASIAKSKVEVFDSQGKTLKCIMEHTGYQHLVWYLEGFDQTALNNTQWYYVRISKISENDLGITEICYPVLVLGRDVLEK